MSALDDLVDALQASLSSVQTAREHGVQAVAAAQTAVEAAGAFGRDRAVADTEALRAGIEEAGGILATVETRLIELLQRALALRQGTMAGTGGGTAGAGVSVATVPVSLWSQHPAAPSVASLRLADDRRRHVLDGDGDGRGGHRHGTGIPGKSEFPAEWDDDTVAARIRATAVNPSSIDYSPATKRRPEQWKCQARHGGVNVVAIVRADGQIWTAWPTDGPGVHRNPWGRS